MLYATLLLLIADTNPAAGILVAKCAACHGPDVAQVRFGIVDNLSQLATSKYIVAGDPEKSLLWQQISSGKMPPEESPSGPLAAGDLDAIRQWIVSLAPAAPPEKPAEKPAPAAQVAPDVPEQTVLVKPLKPALPGPGFWARAGAWLGKLHLISLHFPVVLLTLALLLSAWGWWQGERVPAVSLRLCVVAGAIACVPVVALGWLHAAHGWGAGQPDTLWRHRWLGTLTGLSALAAALLVELDLHRGRQSWTARGAVLLAAVLVVLTGHYGGSLVHGKGFFVP